MNDKCMYVGICECIEEWYVDGRAGNGLGRTTLVLGANTCKCVYVSVLRSDRQAGNGHGRTTPCIRC